MTGSSMPFSVTVDVVRTANSVSHAAITSLENATSSAAAMPQKRLPTLTVSPVTAYWRRTRDPTWAAITSPLCSPMP